MDWYVKIDACLPAMRQCYHWLMLSLSKRTCIHRRWDFQILASWCITLHYDQISKLLDLVSIAYQTSGRCPHAAEQFWGWESCHPQQYLVAYLKVPVPVILLWKHTQNVIYNTSPGTCPNVQTWSSCSLRCSMNRQLCTRKLFTDCTEYWTTLTHGTISTSRGPTGLWYTHRSSYFNFTHFDDKGISKTVTRT